MLDTILKSGNWVNVGFPLVSLGDEGISRSLIIIYDTCEVCPQSPILQQDTLTVFVDTSVKRNNQNHKRYQFNGKEQYNNFLHSKEVEKLRMGDTIDIDGDIRIFLWMNA